MGFHDPDIEYQDKQITCKDCGTVFLFEAGEQKYYQSRDFVEPTRCKPCREKKKIARAKQAQEGKYDKRTTDNG
jgi:hypothetical protein